MDKETADKTRGMVRRVTLKNIKDTGQTQTASIEVADGIYRDDVEILQPFGFSSHASEDGALALVLAVGGDEGDQVVLPIGNPSKRMGGLQPGESGIHNEDGDKIVLTKGGVIQIRAASALNVVIGGVTFNVSAAGVDITGGRVTHNGHDIGDTHKHGGIVQGGQLTDVPAN